MAISTGLRRYTGDEVGNLFLGQAGFDTIASGIVETDKGGESQWIAVKAVGASTLTALTNIGDHLTDDGTTTGTSVSLSDGDIVFGSFYKITRNSGLIIAYKG
tara:strand:- start:907 stop:1215 length:309 start_codon:yes stop_codon:yes gene_type:complete